MVNLNRDINFLSRHELGIVLNLPAGDLDALIERRRQSPLTSLEEVAELTGLKADILVKLEDAGLLFFGQDAEDIGLQPLPDPEPVPPSPATTGPRPGVANVMLGLSQMLYGVAQMLPDFQEGNAEVEEHPSTLPPLEEGQHRKLSDAKVHLLVPQSGYMHAPPQGPFGAPGGFGHHTFLQEVIPPCYCAYVWILKGRMVNGQEVGSSTLASGSTGSGIVQQPTPDNLDKVIEDMHHANTIFAPGGFQFCLCQVKVLDTAQMTSSNGDPTLADTLFSPTGAFYGKDETDPSKIKPFQRLFDGFQYESKLSFEKRCLNLFYVADVHKSPQTPDTQTRKAEGVGGPLRTTRRDSKLTPVGAVEGGGDTIAHEVAHGLGLLHIDRDYRENELQQGESRFDETRSADANNLMRKVPTGELLNDFQFRAMRRAIQTNKLALGCPGE